MALPPSNRKQSVSDYNLPEDVLSLSKHLRHILDVVEGVYEQHGIPLPSRRYWMIGDPSEDCEQVVVSFLQSYLGVPGDQAAEAQSCNSPITAVVNIYITRNFPMGESGRALSPESIMSASEWVAVDTWALMTAMKQFDKDEWGVPGPGVIATVTGRSPNGGVQSTIMNLSSMVLL